MPLKTFWRGQVAPQHTWIMVLGVGLLLWLAAVGVYLLTRNFNQIPTITQLGSYLVPVTYMVWVYQNGRQDEITVQLVFKGFVAGGVLGTLAASLLETYLLDTTSVWVYAGVGFIEEGAKVGALMLVGRNLVRRTPRDGIILGAAVGFGFAGFETSGYALNALLSGDRFDLTAMVQTELLRGLLAPLGHGLWTGILGGLLFLASQGNRWKLRPAFWSSFVAVSLIHALWNAMPGLGDAAAQLVTQGTDALPRIRDDVDGHPLTSTHTPLATFFCWVGLLAIALVGTAWYRRLLQRFEVFAPAARYGWHWRSSETRRP